MEGGGGGLLKIFKKKTWGFNKNGKSRFLFWFVIVLRIVIKKKNQCNQSFKETITKQLEVFNVAVCAFVLILSLLIRFKY